jgi:hypothetical protein
MLTMNLSLLLQLYLVILKSVTAAASAITTITDVLNLGIKSIRQLQSEVSLTLVIQFDAYPEDTGWTLTSEDGSQVIASVNAGTYSGLSGGSMVKRVIAVVAGQRLRFTIVDAYADGIADPGYYAMFFGNDPPPVQSNLIFIQDQFDDREDTVFFTAAMLSTPAPTVAFPTKSPAPTSSPTSCSGAKTAITINSFETSPLFESVTTVFSTNGLCTQHKSYAACTNEAGEDCQWIFFSSSSKKGTCRVDPVTKCLKIGNCVCYTEDFHGGTSEYGNGIVFHAPVSITPRDISEYASLMSYKETYTQPTTQDPLHPSDDDFFISKVDFTARQLEYTFQNTSPVLFDVTTHTFTFKLHYLYMDTPMVGRIWNGIGMVVDMDTSGSKPVLTINSVAYTLAALKKWTCTQVVITPKTIYVAGTGVSRNPSLERRPAEANKLTLGQFSGELFDVRIYAGTLSYLEIREVGARCTGPKDPAVLKVSRDIDVRYDREGCTPRLYFPVPSTGEQTYASGPFATMWVKPKIDPLDPNVWLDIPEGEFDEERFFQHKKLQSYLWEKYYFENDMIAFNLKPYRYFASPGQIPEYARIMYNNPCRYMHQSNNEWTYPFYGENTIPKWTAAKHGTSSSSVFDLATVIRNLTVLFGGYSLVAHEAMHEFQQTLYRAYGVYGNQWIDESSASFGPAFTMPGFDNIYATFPLAIGYPLGYENNPDLANVNSHFHSAELSFNNNIRGGHIYNSWLMWWFLAEFADMPHLLGQMYTTEKRTEGVYNGLLHTIRLSVEAENMDFGDVWGIFVAHYRTWDFGSIGTDLAFREEEHLSAIKSDPNVQPPIPDSVTLEGRKTTVELNPTTGTNGVLIAGPSGLRPGPFGWNCLTARGVQANRFVAVTISWDEGMGFQANTSPSTLPAQQSDCDEDQRFYNNVVVTYNELTGKRRYWKLKGKKPSTIYVDTGNEGPVTLHILLVPTPPTDYVGGRHFESNTFMSPIPIYGYKYAVEILDRLPSSNTTLVKEASKKDDGIMMYEASTPGWWPVKCTCIDDPNSGICVDPTFPRLSATLSPSNPPVSPPTFNPTTLAPVKLPPIVQPTSSPMAAPTSSPTLAPTAASKPTTLAPSTPRPVTSSPVTMAPIVVPSTLAPSVPITLPPTTSAPAAPLDNVFAPATTTAPIGSPVPNIFAPFGTLPETRVPNTVAPAPSTYLLPPANWLPANKTPAPFVLTTPSPTPGNSSLTGNCTSPGGGSCLVNDDCCTNRCSQSRCLSSAITMLRSRLSILHLPALMTVPAGIATGVVFLLM